MFELTNEQRKYLGLTLVSSTWDLVKLIPSPHVKQDTFVYYDGNTICKRIIISENTYLEHDLNEETTNSRTELLPKTGRGKIVKLTASTLEKRTPKGMYFSYNGNVTIGKWEANRTFYNSYIEDIKLNTFEDLSCWIKQWISETTISDLYELEEFASLPKKHYKYNVGDYFRLKLNRRLYGYGRILLNYDKMRKEKIKFWDILMGKPLVVKVYHIATTDKNISCEDLRNLKAIPSQFIMDNTFFYGEYEIIGNMPLADNELDFPVMYGKSIDIRDSNKVLLQSGKKYFELNRNKAFYSEFKNNGIGFGINVKLPILSKCIELHNNQPYWEQNNYTTNKDLRNPKFYAERETICKQFGVSEEDIFLR
ncbi:immunity 26/phosphotriesterase HocA family protein [Desulfosporosinus hippei]|uniref:Immunity protein 26 n=1 Tax=Desulfosporosinus hippei DSM 8344 TaxID=1121419 RepID=A0A1G8CD02_9FIRM|nr:immunity 26/phosphotriesterase HocA family protein [Desulfosporosinus hippei]SDH43387.1 Immunity protein 26 [Desulfosporosinus hippei DSM 8344]